MIQIPACKFDPAVKAKMDQVKTKARDFCPRDVHDVGYSPRGPHP